MEREFYFFLYQLATERDLTPESIYNLRLQTDNELLDMFMPASRSSLLCSFIYIPSNFHNIQNPIC